MRIIRDYQFTTAEDRGASIAIGNFDGVHLGHQEVLRQARDAQPGVPLGVVTFEPHPRAFFAPDAPAFRLMNAEARAHRLEKLGVDLLYELKFNAALSSLSDEAFVENVLHKGLGTQHVVVGADFRFGKGRTGDAAGLSALCAARGIGCSIAELVNDEQGEFSSTSIREALTDGRPEDARRMLGHWHRIDGVVVPGDQRGRLLGYPTTNISIDGLHPPKFGVYAVFIEVLTGPFVGTYKGAASIGVRPMFGQNRPNLEVFLFDFSGDLYGAALSVALVAYQRPELKFDSLDALIEQMDTDCVQARGILDAQAAN